ncbi:hypothetical protein ACTSKR_08410 [Chitinibacteraceae bacterium HSL-7]
MPKPAPAKYDVALKVRRSLLIWLDPAMQEHAPASGKPGRRPSPPMPPSSIVDQGAVWSVADAAPGHRHGR